MCFHYKQTKEGLVLEKQLETLKINKNKSNIRKSSGNGEVVGSESLDLMEILASALSDSIEKKNFDISNDWIPGESFQSSLSMLKRFSDVLFSLSDSLPVPLSNKGFSESVNESMFSITRNNIRYDHFVQFFDRFLLLTVVISFNSSDRHLTVFIIIRVAIVVLMFTVIVMNITIIISTKGSLLLMFSSLLG